LCGVWRLAWSGRFYEFTPPGGVGARLERFADERDGGAEIAEHELRADADDAEACALQFAIAASVGGLCACVNGTVNLDDELDCRSQEVGDEEPEDGYLAAK